MGRDLRRRRRRPRAREHRRRRGRRLALEPVALQRQPHRLENVALVVGDKHARAGDGQAVVSVRDTGIGIAADRIGGVFEMFSQIDNSLERTHGGLGIGLTLVRRLVEMHGGSVVAKSAGLGQGSEFVVTLPLTQVAADAPAGRAPAAAAPAAPAGRSV